MKDFYYILGTDAGCSAVEIKEAYRKLSKKFHPDLNQNDKYFESRFREIQEAYETLNDPARRELYDRELSKFRASRFYTSPGVEFQAPGPPSSVINNSRRGIDILFTLILISLTCVFGAYVKKAMNESAKAKVNVPVLAPPAVAITVKHYKKKRHHINNGVNAESVPEIVAQNKPIQVKPNFNSVAVVAKANPPKIISTVTARATTKPQPDKTFSDSAIASSAKPPANNSNNSNSGYTSLIRSNITGVVDMKELDNIGSRVVQVIPTGSEVTVLARGASYYKVSYNNITGYVPRWTVKTK